MQSLKMAFFLAALYAALVSFGLALQFLVT